MPRNRYGGRLGALMPITNFEIRLRRPLAGGRAFGSVGDRKSTRLNSSHRCISYAVLRELDSFPTRRSSDLTMARTSAAIVRVMTDLLRAQYREPHEDRNAEKSIRR